MISSRKKISIFKILSIPNCSFHENVSMFSLIDNEKKNKISKSAFDKFRDKQIALIQKKNSSGSDKEQTR